LAASQFADFFCAVHGREAFEWQKRLATEVLAEGFHDVIRVPTGCGKTSVLDVAVFELALHAEREPKKRIPPRRICFVVDRRLVVDEVTEHALQISHAVLAAAHGKRDEPVLRAVAERLAYIAVDRDEPLRVVRLRGSVYRDDGWAADPLTPSILVSTVDQIGSRLLFRGYGVSGRSRPLQAGLLGFDTRIIIDEAHLSSVFVDTLHNVRQFQGWVERAPLSLSRRVGFTRMSATIAERGRNFELSREERKDKRLSGRLKAKKVTELIEVRVDTITKQMRAQQPRNAREQERKNRETLVHEIVKQAKRIAGTGENTESKNRALIIGVIVNRVSTARRVFDKLRNLVDGESDYQAILLTGRIRAYDRDRLLQKWLPSIKAGRKRVNDRTLFVVATQTVEVGANIDFDALITEAAPLDALRQRFGRLDRLGKRYEEGETPSRACILVRSDHKSNSDDDPVYGSTIAETWKWLASKETARAVGKGKASHIEVDFGINNLDQKLLRVDEATLQRMVVPGRDAPILFPAHLDAWAQTDPIPQPDPDVASFLHGQPDAPADVQVIWRGDLNSENQSSWAAIVSLMPPRTREALPVPVYEARAWLSNRAEANITDVEGAAIEASFGEPEQSRRALRWRGTDDAQLIDANGVRPGDTIIVPASYGGADEFGWNPTSKEPVEDVAEPCLAEVIASYPAAAFRRPKLRLRLHPSLFPQSNQTMYAGFCALLESSVHALREDAQNPWPSIRSLLRALRMHSLAPSTPSLVAFLESKSTPKMELYPAASGIVISGALQIPVRDGLGAVEAEAETEFEEPEDDEVSFAPAGREVPLEEHCHSVGRTAAEFALRCGLPDEIAELLCIAGLWHDQGKRDWRFQAWLHGSELRALAALSADRPLAKSGRDPAQWKNTRLFGYPNGARHEFMSVKLFEQDSVVPEERHDLIRFLIGTHHGRGRPFPPVVNDPTPVRVVFEHNGKRVTTTSDHRLYRLDSDWVDLFWRMIRRYGWWGVAFLEALLITADRSVSAREQRASGPMVAESDT
jgi:CRISPR-associated endonuclease/helicase Cas3